MNQEVLGAPEQIDPSLLLMDDNIRWGLKDTRIESLAEDIKESGGVRVPLRVSPLTTPVKGKLYRVNEGHYRTAAAMKLKEGGKEFKELTVPCFIEDPKSDEERLINQLRENVMRESLTPMDTAEAIKKLMDIGKSRTEIRKIFSRPGGRKAFKNSMVSNSFLNYHLKFLEMPKMAQERIHEGRITVGGGLALARHKKEDWPGIIEELEKDRLAELDREDADDAKMAKEEAKITEAKEKEETARRLAEAAEKALQVAEANRDKHKENALTAYKQVQSVTDPKQKQVALEKFKAAETEVKAAIKAADEASKEKARQEVLIEKAKVMAAEQAAKLKAAREGKSPKKKKAGKAAGAAEVAAAAQRSNADAGIVKLNRQGLMDAFEVMIGAKVKAPKVSQIGFLLRALANGANTPNQTVKLMAQVTGELPAKETSAKA